MLIAALVLTLVAFVALVYYVIAAQTIALVVLFGAVAAGIVLFVADWIIKHRSDRRK